MKALFSHELFDVSVGIPRDKGIYLGKELFQLRPVPLHETTRDDEPPALGVCALRLFEYGLDGFAARVRDKGARVDDHHVGLVRKLVSRLLEPSRHVLRIDEVLGTAQAHDPVLHRRRHPSRQASFFLPVQPPPMPMTWQRKKSYFSGSSGQKAFSASVIWRAAFHDWPF